MRTQGIAFSNNGIALNSVVFVAYISIKIQLSLCTLSLYVFTSMILKPRILDKRNTDAEIC